MSKIIVPETPSIVLGVGVSGRFKFIRRRSDESVVQETPFGKNRWLDTGLDFLCGRDFGGALHGFNGCHVGSGNTPAQDGDTALEEFVAGTADVTQVSGFTDVEQRFTRMVLRFRFPVGAATGNLSEVAISIGTSSNAGNDGQPLATRALISDENGSPVTISPQPDEFLDVYWEYTKYAPPTNVTGTFNQEIDGVMQTFNYEVCPAKNENTDTWTSSPSRTLRASRGNQMVNTGSGASSGGFRQPYQFLDPNGSMCDSYTDLAPYVNGTFYRDSRLYFGLDTANFSMTAFKFNNYICGWMMEISPAVQKVATKQYYIDIRNTIGRYSP